MKPAVPNEQQEPMLSVEGKTLYSTREAKNIRKINARVYWNISPPQHLPLRTVENIPKWEAALHRW